MPLSAYLEELASCGECSCRSPVLPVPARWQALLRWLQLRQPLLLAAGRRQQALSQRLQLPGALRCLLRPFRSLAHQLLHLRQFPR